MGKTEGKVLKPGLVQNVLGLTGEENDRCGREGRVTEEEQGEECVVWGGHTKLARYGTRKNASR